MRTSVSLGDLPQCDKSGQTYSWEQCHSYAEQRRNDHWNSDEVVNGKWGLRPLATCQGAVRRRAGSGTSLKDRFARALRHVRSSEAKKKDTLSNIRVREAKIAALVGVPGDEVRERALRVIGELVDFQCQPKALGPRNKGSVPLVTQPRGKALQDRRDTNTAIASDSRLTDFESTHGGSNDVCYWRYSTAARTATVQHAEQNKPRIASVGAEMEVLKSNGTPEASFSDADDHNMPSHLSATALVDHQWLNSRRSFDLKHDNSKPADNGMKKDKDLERISAPLFRDGDDSYDQLITLDLVVDMDGHVKGSPNADIPPEMDSGYDTSESGRSVAEGLAEQYLKPIHSMLDLLPMDINGRFGSYYSPTSEKKPQAQTWPEIVDAAYDENKRQSRFSWTSSIYSDDGLEEKAVWWKPIEPLVVKKEAEQPPPIPKKNPLRLFRRLSESEPGGYNKERRGSRNIHNLYLDLSRSNTRDTRISNRSSTFVRKSSRAHTARKESVKSTSSRPQLSLLIPGHISNAMRTSIEDGLKPRQSTKTSISSMKHSQNHSARDVARGCKTSTTTTAQSRSKLTSTRVTDPRSLTSPPTTSTSQSRNKSAKTTPPRSTSSASVTSRSHGRSQSARDASVETPRRTPTSSSGHAETLRGVRGHVRGSSEPLHTGVSDVSSKWNASMPSHETIRKSCITSLVKDGTTKRRASHAPAINKRLPPLPVDMKL